MIAMTEELQNSAFRTNLRKVVPDFFLKEREIFLRLGQADPGPARASGPDTAAVEPGPAAGSTRTAGGTRTVAGARTAVAAGLHVPGTGHHPGADRAPRTEGGSVRAAGGAGAAPDTEDRAARDEQWTGSCPAA